MRVPTPAYSGIVANCGIMTVCDYAGVVIHSGVRVGEKDFASWSCFLAWARRDFIRRKDSRDPLSPLLEDLCEAADSLHYGDTSVSALYRGDATYVGVAAAVSMALRHFPVTLPPDEMPSRDDIGQLDSGGSGGPLTVNGFLNKVRSIDKGVCAGIVDF